MKGKRSARLQIQACGAPVMCRGGLTDVLCAIFHRASMIHARTEEESAASA